jgi:hypothetical protein
MTAPVPPHSRHDGSPAVAGAVYPEPPDPGIGTVRSAESNRSAAGFLPMDRSYRTRVYEFGALGFLAGWLGLALVQGGAHASPLPWSSDLDVGQKVLCLIAAVGLALLGGGVTWVARPWRASFVGTAGVQESSRRGWGHARSQVARFADVTALRVARTRHTLYGAYNRTTFRFHFVDAQGAPRFRIEGYFDERAPQASSDAYRFALAAEAAWNAWKRSHGAGAT